MSGGPLYNRNSQGLWPSFLTKFIFYFGILLIPVTLVLGIMSVVQK